MLVYGQKCKLFFSCNRLWETSPVIKYAVHNFFLELLTEHILLFVAYWCFSAIFYKLKNYEPP